MSQLPIVRLLLLFIFIQIFLSGNAQNARRPLILNEIASQKPGEGKVEIIQDKKIDDLLRKYIESNSKKSTITGYRICIFSKSKQGVAKTEADVIRTKFILNFPGIEASKFWDPPDWRVFVGNFRNHTDAFRLKKQIEKVFPNCYIVEIQIDYSKL